jgi:phospholipid N-methyltransferase
LAIEAESAYRGYLIIKEKPHYDQISSEMPISDFRCYKNLTISESFHSKLSMGINLLAIDLGLAKKLSELSVNPGDELFPLCEKHIR